MLQHAPLLSALIPGSSSICRVKVAPFTSKDKNPLTRPVAGGGAGRARAPPEIFRLELNSATKVEFFY